ESGGRQPADSGDTAGKERAESRGREPADSGDTARKERAESRGRQREYSWDRAGRKQSQTAGIQLGQSGVRAEAGNRQTAGTLPGKCGQKAEAESGDTKFFSDWFIVVRNAGPGFPPGLFGRGDLENSRVSDHDKPIRESLLAYAAVKVLLRLRVNGEREFSMAPQRRLAYNADFKLKAINHAKQHGNRDAAREFNINESMVRKWRHFRGHKRWISEQRAAGRSFSTVAVQIQAKAIANEMGIEDFKAGPSWCFRFMKRRQLSIRTRTTVCQRLPVDYEEKVVSFRSYCKSKITENNIEAKHIINMDEVPLTFDMPLTRTVEKTGTPTVPVRTTGNEKTSFTVVLGVSSDGQKLSPMVIFKRKTFPKEKFPNGIVVAVNTKGWMHEDVMKTWLKEVYARAPQRFFKVPGLLVLDSMCAHKTDSVKALVEQMNSKLTVIPGGLTKELQPLDISVICSFKAKLRVLWENWMVEGEHSYTTTGRLRRASYSTVCKWILDAWSKVTRDTIIRGFARADIIPELNTSDGTEGAEPDDSEDEDTGFFSAEGSALHCDTGEEASWF
uniref:HTH CENPB-type domain-containing protein n=1 Tax=Catharus ustulatus TaxID=91951 RepID=A0A8C3UMK4_CATUS